jgi:hypothetical protein
MLRLTAGAAQLPVAAEPAQRVSPIPSHPLRGPAEPGVVLQRAAGDGLLMLRDTGRAATAMRGGGEWSPGGTGMSEVGVDLGTRFRLGCGAVATCERIEPLCGARLWS